VLSGKLRYASCVRFWVNTTSQVVSRHSLCVACSFQGKALFLGNYLNGGSQQLHVACYMLLLMARFPDSFHFLRGMHDTFEVNASTMSPGSFASACKASLPTDVRVKTWRQFMSAFWRLPTYAVVDNKYFCAPGGLATAVYNLEEFESDWRTHGQKNPSDANDSDAKRIERSIYELMCNNLVAGSNNNVSIGRQVCVPSSRQPLTLLFHVQYQVRPSGDTERSQT
jgi:hypothetical protein